uniref:Armadillo repeat-containing protein n=1 Tax=Mesocestoides corti TaxID=53468 RepID=A0A5K3EM46_MESCO
MVSESEDGLASLGLPPLPPAYANIPSNSTTAAQPPHFYLGSSSGDGTCDQFFTEFELNSKANGYTEAHFSGGETNEAEDTHVEKGLRIDINSEEIQHIVGLLSEEHPDVSADAAAYICHITYNNPEIKSKVAEADAIQVLSTLILSNDLEVKKHSIYALRNLSHEATAEIRKKLDDASVISNILIAIDEATANDMSSSQVFEAKNTIEDKILESATAALCNLALYPEFKDIISRHGVPCLTKSIIVPYSGVSRKQTSSAESEEASPEYELPAFIYATGTIRNILDDNAECRQRLRETTGLVAALSYVCSQCVDNYDFDGKALENCVCILRNLSFALQEIRDPAYLVRREAAYSRAATTPLPERKLVFKHPRMSPRGQHRGIEINLRKQPATNIWMSGGPDYLSRPPSNLESIQGSRLLWAKELVENYISILRRSTNLITIEAVAGAIQNLTACDWQPSAEVRGHFRNGDNVLVLAALLISEADNVVMTTATALRNLAEDKEMRSLVALYAMRLLIARLPVLQHTSAHVEDTAALTHDIVSLSTTSAILATIYVLIKEDSDQALLFLDCGGVPPCLAIAHTGLYVDLTDPVPSNRDKTVRFARFLLQALWAHSTLQDRFKKAGWHASHFCVNEPALRSVLRRALSPANRHLQDAREGAEIMKPETTGEQVILGPINEQGQIDHENERRIEYPSEDFKESSLLPAANSFQPDPTSGRPLENEAHLGIHPPRLAASAIDVKNVNGQSLPAHPNSLPVLQLPDSSSGQPSPLIRSRQASRLSVAREADRHLGGLSQRSQSQIRFSNRPSAQPPKQGYLSQLNIFRRKNEKKPEVIAVHPSPKRGKLPERAVSPFLQKSVSNLDVSSLEKTVLNAPGKSQSHLCVPGQQELPASPARSTNRRAQQKISCPARPTMEKPLPPTRSLSQTSFLTQASEFPLPPAIIPASPTVTPPSAPKGNRSRPAPPTPKPRTRHFESTMSQEGHRGHASRPTSVSLSQSQLFRFTAPPLRSPLRKGQELRGKCGT